MWSRRDGRVSTGRSSRTAETGIVADRACITNAGQHPCMTEIVRDERHSGGAPTVGETGIRVVNVAGAYEHKRLLAGRDHDVVSGSLARGRPHRTRLLLRPRRGVP